MVCKRIMIIMGVLIICLGSTVYADLVAHLTFDEMSGTVAADSSGNGYDGAIFGNPKWVPGYFGGALELSDIDGTQDYVEFAAEIGDAIVGLTDCTFATWADFANVGGTWQRIFEFSLDGTRNMFLIPRIAADGVLRFGITITGANTEERTDAPYTMPSGWHHVAVTIDEVAPGQVVHTLYLDGEVVGQNNAATLTPSSLGAPTTLNWLGQPRWINDGYYNGALDEFRIYNNTLSQGEIQGVMEGGDFPQAYGPNPAHEAVLDDTSLTLTWKPGAGAASHNVYIGENYDDVNEGAVDAFFGNILGDSLEVGAPGGPYPEGLVPGTTYYWRIDEVSTGDPDNPLVGTVWSFSITSKIAFDPVPPDGDVFVPNDLNLRWGAGSKSTSHEVYVGTSFDEVANATTGAVVTSEPNVFLDLDRDTTYFWRVDEVNDEYGTVKGDVWSFTTAPIRMGVATREMWFDIPGVAVGDLRTVPAFPTQPDRTDEVPSLESLAFIPEGMEDDGYGGINDYGARMYAWLYVPVTGEYTFYFSSDNNGELWLGTSQDDASNVELICSVPNSAGQSQFNKYLEQTSSPLQLDPGLYYIEALWKEDEGRDFCQVAWKRPGEAVLEIIDGRYLSPFEGVKAMIRQPGSNAVDVPQDVVLSWNPGGKATMHDVYFGMDLLAVRDADTSTTGIYQGRQTLDQATLDVGHLDWNTIYYWRIDEINDLNPDSPWIGNVWQFTTADFVVLDDFESYLDTRPDRIFETWRDRYAYTDSFGNVVGQGNGTGMTVGVEQAPFGPERIIVNHGFQSMPLIYDNTETPYYSETDRTFEPTENFTSRDGRDLKTLNLWYRGRMASPNGFTADGSNYTVIGSGADIWNESDEFFYVYQPLEGNGTITVRVDSIEDVDDWAKAGVMIRDTLDPESVNLTLDVTPANRVEFITRLIPGAASESVTTDANSISLPHWLRLTRQGSLVLGQHSSNGQTWSTVSGGSTILIAMPGTNYIGLAVTSRVSAAITCQAEFSNVAVTGTDGSEFSMSADIGLPINMPANLYVALNDGSDTAAVNHPDGAAAVLNDSWRLWSISLSDFSDQGIDLAQIRNMIIGVGDKQPDGEGKLYIDDIQLSPNE